MLSIMVLTIPGVIGARKKEEEHGFERVGPRLLDC